jgi:hypothetical protein
MPGAAKGISNGTPRWHSAARVLPRRGTDRLLAS